MIGRAATAPCGHAGECVVGTYVRCLTPGCDGRAGSGVPAHVDPEKTQPICRACGSDDLEPYLTHAFRDVYRCRRCGATSY